MAKFVLVSQKTQLIAKNTLISTATRIFLKKKNYNNKVWDLISNRLNRRLQRFYGFLGGFRRK